MRKACGILLLGVVALAGCNSETSRTVGGGDVLAAAGIPGAVAATALSEQDSTPMVVRRVWGGPDVDLFGGVSPDGRYLTFVDWTTGNLAVRELATGEVRLLTDDGSWAEPQEWAEFSSVSPDGKRVAYRWYRHGAPPSELRIVGMNGSGRRVLYRNAGSYFGSGVWSPDGEQIVTVQSYVDGPVDMLSISAADGSVQTLKRFESSWPGGLSFSPDGRFIVYHHETKKDSPERDIFVLELDGGREIPLVQHPADDYVLGWTPDGEHILFASDRTGTLGAWLLPVAGSAAAGHPRLVKPDMWRVLPLGFTQDGSFFYGVNMEARDVYVASLDPETGGLLAPPASVNPTHLAWDYRPAWSPDGRYLVFLSGEGALIGTAFKHTFYSIRSVETGETRQLVPDLNDFGRCVWWIDGHSLLVPGADRTDRAGLFRVDVHTGEAEPLPAFWDVQIASLVDPSPDGKKVFYTKWTGGGERRIAVMDLDTGRERLLFPDENEARPALSADGRYLAFSIDDNNSHRILVMPATGGEPRELQRYEAEGPTVLNVAWSPDGRNVLYTVRTDDTHQLWRISVAGGLPQKIDLAMESIQQLRIHPDGRRIAFDAGSGGAEVWVMENFLPAE